MTPSDRFRGRPASAPLRAGVLAAALTGMLATASTAEEGRGAAPRAVSHEWAGFIEVEARTFADSPVFAGQDGDATASLVLEPELCYEWRGSGEQPTDRLVARPFVRLDSADDERSHLDLRELYWQRIGRGWQLDVGLRKVFWGVTESVHLVDIVNQTDTVEDPDGEDKLGQPMVRVSWSRPWGLLELYLLPGFRERTFPGVDGRLRPGIPIEPDRARYESDAEDGHVDVAARWSRVLGDVDLGLSYFRGTSREPLLAPAAAVDGRVLLVPFYPQIDQLGLDLQATLGPWLWKLEAAQRFSRDPGPAGPGFGDHAAAVGGFEYTFFDLAGSGLDVGLLAEYQWDERGTGATTPFQDDVFVGSRLDWNDVAGTELLVGAALDLESDALFVNVEGSRRLGERYELELRLRFFDADGAAEPLTAFDRDDYLQLSLRRYF